MDITTEIPSAGAEVYTPPPLVGETNLDYYAPWNNGQEPMEVYHQRSTECLPILLLVIVVYIGIFAYMFFRYHTDRYVIKAIRYFSGYSALFWIMFIVSIIWALLTLCAVWYACVEWGSLAGLLLSIAFIFLLIALLVATIEQEHLSIVFLYRAKYTSDKKD